MNKKENTARISFAREAEKTEKTVMDVVNGEKNGIAAVACGNVPAKKRRQFAGL